ncbi:hypothetical protein BDV27DRAFT_130732 [Aspergillus caelatus]|uniref:Uncharacterized protein n=1 Tax=Aspergillus caelatus TaxID=61420 RepID=A0A5N6ZZI1_9EURO|nr:uncharacterized protein BDV27DRAFT_130732 [Aspergillus caelatus]KAE8362942.1 hypothetical protein BDV27DRAFT_130732 [Aspergillus caelatus]
MNELQGCLAGIIGINQGRCVQYFETIMFAVPPMLSISWILFLVVYVKVKEET